DLRGHHSITPEIASKIGLAKTLVVVLSPSFLNSEWCRTELALFRQQFDASNNERIFVVDIAGPASAELKGIGLDDLKRYRFWYRDENMRMRTYGDPEPRPDEREYYRLVGDLATGVADVLKVTNGSAAAARPTSGPVLLTTRQFNQTESNDRRTGGRP